MKAGKLYDYMTYSLYATYDIITTTESYSATKKQNYTNIRYESNYRNGYFDSYGPRKSAYKTSANQILSTFKKTDISEIKGHDKVKIYKKRRK